jgi:hypothetical protein
MQVEYTGDHPIVREAVTEANRLLKDQSFLEEIAARPTFDMSTASPATIAELIRSSSLRFVVQLFSPRGVNKVRYRKTFAYTDGRYPNTLFLNEAKLDREMADVAATIIHEAIHALDDSEPGYQFGHGSNSPRGKENTAPYWIGNRAYQLLTAGEGTTAPSVDEVEEGIVADA